MRELLVVLLLLICYSCDARQLRHSKLDEYPERQPEQDVECVVVQGHLRYEDGHSDEWSACMTDDNVVYDLPEEIISGDLSAQSGKTKLLLKGVQPHASLSTDEPDYVAAGRNRPQVTQVPMGRSATTKGTIPTMGISKIIAVRVTSQDATLNVTADDLRSSLFGTNVSVSEQFKHCSNGQFQLIPAEGEGIQGGVGELTLDVPTRGVPSGNLHGLLREGFAAKYGSESDYGHILFCLPEGTGEEGKGWIAYAFNDTPLSFYNNLWCASLTSVMHEVSHNMGLGHSGEDGGHYEDKSCIMGVSYRRSDGPQECFNGYRHWAMGWFAKHQIELEPSAGLHWGGRLAAFVDVSNFGKSQYFAIIKIGELFLQYNRATKYNWEVDEKANQVTVVEAGTHVGAPSTMLVGLDTEAPLYNFTTPEGVTIVIQVCQPGSSNGVEYFEISIHELGLESMCGSIPSVEQTAQETLESETQENVENDVERWGYRTNYDNKRDDEPEVEEAKEESSPEEETQNNAQTEDTEEKEDLPTQDDASACRDSTEKFTLSEVSIDCQWLASKPSMRHLYCQPGSLESFKCPKTCHECKGQQTKTPIIITRRPFGG